MINRTSLFHGRNPGWSRVIAAVLIAPLLAYLIEVTVIAVTSWLYGEAEFVGEINGHVINDLFIGAAIITLPYAYFATFFVGVPGSWMLARINRAGILPVVSLGIVIGIVSLLFLGFKLWPLVLCYSIAVPLAGWYIAYK